VINELFTSNEYKLDDNFVATMKKKFYGDVHAIDFVQDGDILRAHAMNDAIANVTDKRLKSFVSRGNCNPIHRNILRMVL